MTTVIVVDDHQLVRQSIVKVIDAEEDFTVVGHAGDGATALRLVEEHDPDVVLLDVDLPDSDGLQVAVRIRQVAAGTRIILLTMHEDESTVRGAIAIEIEGFVPKSASTDELTKALGIVAGGSTYLSPSIAARVMDLARARSNADGGAPGLSARELEILRMLARGYRASEVAEGLYVSIKTVKNHLTSIYAKLGVKTAAQAVAKAYQEGLALRSSA